MATNSTRETAREIPVDCDARQRLLDFYRERDEQHEGRYADGEERKRGIYALGIARLETDMDVFESYQVLRSAGIEIDAKSQAYIESLTRDWKLVCRIDAEGRVWTASLRQKQMSSW